MQKLIEAICKDAGANGQVGTVSHVYAYCLENSSHIGAPNIKSAIARLKTDILAYLTPEQVMPGKANVKLPLCSFQYQMFSNEYEKWRNEQVDLPKNRYDSILIWLLDRKESADQTEQLSRELCRKNGLTVFTFRSEGEINRHASGMGFGELVDEHWIERYSNARLYGRDEDSRAHLEGLSLALVRGRHYVIDGQAGVGKTTFIKKLLCDAVETWRISHESALRRTRFLFCTTQDFIGTEEESRTKIENLYSFLNGRPEIVPVFDQFEQILNGGLGMNNAFISNFGSIVQSNGRSCVFVVHSDAASNELLRNISRSALRELSPEPTREILFERLPSYLKMGDSVFEIEDGQERFCDELIGLASSRYPGHYRPRICLDLVEGALNRAIHRQLRNQEPIGQVTLNDLREHIAQERQISTELLGKDPTNYYLELGSRLREDIIGQDHAIDVICNVLARQAKMPPRRTPRGRFLFVGPPGVGKTQLGRQLALRLGYGEEGFFVVNMSEYSSDGARTRFLGADPGYVGFGATQTIFDKVRSRPSCVVLLDEVDRSHPSIQDILLGILEGEGKDALGATVHFSNVIFVMTTNQGQDQVVSAYESAMNDILGRVSDIDPVHLFVSDKDDKIDSSNDSLAAILDELEVAREGLIKDFANEDRLRDLMLKGAIDQAELDMIGFVDNAIETCRKTFLIESEARQDGEIEESAAAIEAFIRLKRTRQDLERVHSKAALDRALLDRIDFIVPFFPIKEPPLLAKILNIKLKTFGWEECAVAIRGEILEAAMKQQESIRPLERLIIRRMSEGALTVET